MQWGYWRGVITFETSRRCGTGKLCDNFNGSSPRYRYSLSLARREHPSAIRVLTRKILLAITCETCDLIPAAADNADPQSANPFEVYFVSEHIFCGSGVRVFSSCAWIVSWGATSSKIGTGLLFCVRPHSGHSRTRKCRTPLDSADGTINWGVYHALSRE